MKLYAMCNVLNWCRQILLPCSDNITVVFATVIRNLKINNNEEKSNQLCLERKTESLVFQCLLLSEVHVCLLRQLQCVLYKF